MFNLILAPNNKLVDIQQYLPKGGNYSTECSDCCVVKVLPDVLNPTNCLMTCKCPKVMIDGTIKYYPASIHYDFRIDNVSTRRDGRLYIGLPK
jgi:hypothetical protein